MKKTTIRSSRCELEVAVRMPGGGARFKVDISGFTYPERQVLLHAIAKADSGVNFELSLSEDGRVRMEFLVGEPPNVDSAVVSELRN
jgi:hypothetical protein